MRTCSVEGCGGKHSAKGYCTIHYGRWIRTGQLENLRHKSKNRKCSIPECEEKHFALGYCRKHHGRWIRTHQVDVDSRYKNRKCSIPGCERRHQAKGWCQYHYELNARRGSPLAVTHYESTDGICEVNGCNNKIYVRRLCNNHYTKLQRYGIDPRQPATCYICGRSPSTWGWGGLTVEHVIPKSRGGSDVAENVRVACGRCNKAKSEMTYEELLVWCHDVLEYHDEIAAARR